MIDLTKFKADAADANADEQDLANAAAKLIHDALVPYSQAGQIPAADLAELNSDIAELMKALYENGHLHAFEAVRRYIVSLNGGGCGGGGCGGGCGGSGNDSGDCGGSGGCGDDCKCS